MTIVEALRQKGGQGNTIAEAVSTLPSGGGGGGLPAVTASDNGNVLTVVEGVWAKATPSGGSYFEDLGLSMNGYQGNVTWEAVGHDLVATITGVMDVETAVALYELPQYVVPVISEFEVSFGNHIVTFNKASLMEATDNSVSSTGFEMTYKLDFVEANEVLTGVNLVFYAGMAEWATGTMTVNLPEVEFVKVNDELASAMRLVMSVL